MMRRILCVLLCVALLLPFAATTTWAASGAYQTCADIPFAYNGIRTVDGNNEIFSYGTKFETPIDLTAYGYPVSGTITQGKLALQMDICVSGKDAVVKAMETHPLGGQLEISSSGTCDKNELCTGAGILTWKANAWNRVTVDLSQIASATGGAFDPTNFNYMRIYVGNLAAYSGECAYVKFANVQVVDLTKPLSEAPALGDGTAGNQIPPQSVNYDAPGYKEIADLGYRKTVMTYASGEVYSAGIKLPQAIDLTAHGYPKVGAIETGKLALQMDYYIEAEENAAAILEKGQLGGQIEISSSGACDVQELAMIPSRLKGKNGEWVRLVLDLSWFVSKTGGEFNPATFNYFRMYLSVPKNYPDERLTMKFCNLRLVDLTQPLSEEEAPALGDGTFTPDTPVFEAQPVWDGYTTDTAVVAGYNLREYAIEHDMLPVSDWSPLIQSLLYGLSARGGGALYIPAGTYPCYGEILLPPGCTLQGDWINPEESVEIGGTILAVYAGKNSNSGSFVTMGNNSYIRSMAFWYPEQTEDNPTPYPYTITMATTTHLKDITLVNSYYGITVTGIGASCPDMENIYGTPLACGLDMDMIADSYGMENVNFAPEYWINSGLSGAPASAEAESRLREYLYYSATGMVIRRMDWSWTTYSTIKGYSVGIHFALSSGGNWYPNGQCYDITLEDCYTALQVDGVGGAGMVMNRCYIKGCEYGVFFAGNGRLFFLDSEIEANVAATLSGEQAKLSFLSSVIRRGAVNAAAGWLTVLNTKFHTAAPQVSLLQGAQAAVMAAATDSWGDAITVANKAYCLLVQEDENPLTEKAPVISREEGLYQHHRPASSAVTVAELDNTGATDVSEALNALLSAQAATGGTVFLKPGFYRLDNPITVPTGVELLGSLDFGQAELYNGVGSILQIYHGKNQPNEATIILEAGAGLRGVQINYPEQNVQADGSFVPYAHTVQGRGDGAYVINVSSRNSWSGVDFMTWRCDNHYIDSFRGNALKNFVAVGGGAENGVVRNCHLQYTSWTYGDDGTRGGWPRVVDGDNAAREAWRMDLYIFSGHNLDCYTIGHVKNQLHFGNMNYCGYTGINVIPEDTGLADVTVWGQNTDCCTISMNVEAAKRVDFISLQTTAFTWVPERQEAEMNLIHLGSDCDITVNVFGAALYENPDHMFDVENGTLNIYGAVYMSSKPLALIGDHAKVNLVDFYMSTYNSGNDDIVPPPEVPSTINNPQNMAVSYSFYAQPLAAANTLGKYTHVYEASVGFRMDVAENMQIPADGDILFSEAFTDYGNLPEEQQKVVTLLSGKGGSVTPRRGNLQITHAKNTFMAAISAADQFELTKGNYRLETRINLESMRETEGSSFTLAVYNQKGATMPIARFMKDGSFEVKSADAWQKVGTFKTGTWYRLGVVVNMDEGTYTVSLMDDNYNTVASGGKQYLAASALTGMWMYVEAETGDEGTKTVAQVDYIAVIATAEGYGMTGDVNGDGKVDSTDARLTLQYAVKKITASALNVGVADVNGDSKVDSTDARLILQYAVKKITTFPKA